MKFLINLFWNILALLVIIIFLSGGIFCLIGTLGQDIFETISFVISSRNLLSSSPKIFENDASIYLDTCVNGNGDIAEDLGIDTDLGKIGELKTFSEDIDKMINSLNTKRQDITNIDLVYLKLISEIEKRYMNLIDYGFIDTNTKNTLILSETIKNLNKELKTTCSIDDTWSLSCYPQAPCSSEINTGKCMNPKICIFDTDNSLITRYSATSCTSTENYINIIKGIFTSINFANNDDNTNSIKKKASDVKSAYSTFLNDALDALNGFTEKFRIFSIIFNEFIGNGSILSLVNCAFIGKNVKIMLHYLDSSIGKGFITFGSVLEVIGFIILWNIAFTILLLSIINEEERLRNIEIKMNANTNLNEAYYPNVAQSGTVVVPYTSNSKM